MIHFTLVEWKFGLEGWARWKQSVMQGAARHFFVFQVQRLTVLQRACRLNLVWMLEVCECGINRLKLVVHVLRTICCLFCWCFPWRSSLDFITDRGLNWLFFDMLTLLLYWLTNWTECLGQDLLIFPDSSLALKLTIIIARSPASFIIVRV